MVEYWLRSFSPWLASIFLDVAVGGDVVQDPAQVIFIISKNPYSTKPMVILSFSTPSLFLLWPTAHCPPLFLSNPVSSPLQWCAVAAWRWRWLPRPCPPPLCCRRTARHCHCAAAAATTTRTYCHGATIDDAALLSSFQAGRHRHAARGRHRRRHHHHHQRATDATTASTALPSLFRRCRCHRHAAAAAYALPSHCPPQLCCCHQCRRAGHRWRWAKEPVMRASCDNNLHKINVDNVISTLGMSFGGTRQH